MNEQEIKRKFPRASKSFVAINANRETVSNLNYPNTWTTEEERALRLAYGADYQIFSLDQIAIALGKTRAAVACKANELGISDKTRRCSDVTREFMRSTRKGKPSPHRGKKTWKNKPHPRGMLGKHHSLEVCERISQAHLGKKKPRSQVLKRMQTRIARYGSLAINRRHGSWRAGWRIVGTLRFYARSLWEANYARYLEFLKNQKEIKGWRYETKTFWFNKIKRGSASYLPDFEVTRNDGTIEYHEVKGWMDARSKTKLRRMKKYYPDIILKLIDGSWFRANARKLSLIVPEWESKNETLIEIT